jgi:hypothetical protein
MNDETAVEAHKQRQGRNLEPVALAELELDPKDATAYLLALRRSVEERARDAIAWYLRYKTPVAHWSKALRLGAIVLATAGAVLPLVGTTPLGDLIQGASAGEYGYVLLALAGALVVGDRVFGLSSRWMRYMVTAMALQRRLAQFEMDWAGWWLELGGQQPNPEQQARAIALLRDFRLAVVTEVEDETRVWVAEFESGLAQLERMTRQESARDKPDDGLGKRGEKPEQPAQGAG